MKLSFAALAAVLFAGGTAVGFATGNQMATGSGETDQLGSIETAALVEDQNLASNALSEREQALEKRAAEIATDQEKIRSQFEELSTLQQQVVQRESELDTQAIQLEEQLASMEEREDNLSRMLDDLRVDSKALEEQQAELGKQADLISEQLQSVLERERQVAALEEKLASASAAISALDLAEATETKLDLQNSEVVSNEADDAPTYSEVELSTVALQDTESLSGNLGEGRQPEQSSGVDTLENASELPVGALAEVHFEKNSARLTPGALQRAREAAKKLETMNFSKIRIAGHTDTTGSISRNRVLSSQRAEAVADVFVQAGVSRQMIEIVGFGETLDMLPISTADGVSEPLNRCVGIFVE